MHWLDAMWLYVPRDRLFAGGFGDCDRVMKVAEPFLAPHEAQPLDLKWGAPVTKNGVERRLGTAASPCPLAVVESQQLTVLRLTPTDGPVRGRAILPPSWSEQDFRMRERLYLPLVKQGVELWLLEAPFFGLRRPKGQVGVGLRTVADLLAMGVCSLMELRGMVAAAREEEPSLPVVLSGFSMAGQFSAQVAATLPWDVPVVTMSPSDSAIPVFVEGPISKSVDWKTLEKEGGKERLVPLLEQFGLLNLAPPPSKKKILLATRRDGIVPPAAFERIAGHWKVEPRWLDWGHLGGFLFAGSSLRQAVLETLTQPAA